MPEVKAVRLADPDEILDRAADARSRKADYVVADGPGSNTETSRALLLRADLALVPCKASMLEVRALAQATNVLRAGPGHPRRAAAGHDRAQHGRQELPADPGHERRRGGAGIAAGQDRR